MMNQKHKDLYTVTKEIRFCYGHRLIDYDGPCANIHGHNAKVHVELTTGELDKRGMVFDFSDIQRVIKGWIDQTLDHTLILNQKDPMVSVLKKKKERFLVINSNPTAEKMARLIYDYAVSKKFPVSQVTLWETETSFATYRGS